MATISNEDNEMLQEALDRAYEESSKQIEDDINKQNEDDIKALTNEIDSEIKSGSLNDKYAQAYAENNNVQKAVLGSQLIDWENMRQEYKRRIDTENKANRKKVVLGGLTEAAAAIANLIGTGKHATPVNVSNMTADWMKKAEQEKKANDDKYTDLVQKQHQAKRDAILAQQAMKMGLAKYQEQVRQREIERQIAADQQAYKRGLDELNLRIKLRDSDTKAYAAEQTALNNAIKAENLGEHYERQDEAGMIRAGAAATSARAAKVRADKAQDKGSTSAPAAPQGSTSAPQGSTSAPAAPQRKGGLSSYE